LPIIFLLNAELRAWNIPGHMLDRKENSR